MAIPDELARAFQAQMAQMQESMKTQMAQLQAQMQATFDQNMANLTHARTAGGSRVESRDERFERDLFDEKHFRFCEKFDGMVTKWDEWKFTLLTTVKGRSAECGDAMDDVLGKAAFTRDLTAIRIDTTAKEKFSNQLFKVLCWLTTGEANIVVRSVNDKGVGWCGFAELCLLSQRFESKTTVRIL